MSDRVRTCPIEYTVWFLGRGSNRYVRLSKFLSSQYQLRRTIAMLVIFACRWVLWAVWVYNPPYRTPSPLLNSFFFLDLSSRLAALVTAHTFIFPTCRCLYPLSQFKDNLQPQLFQNDPFRRPRHRRACRDHCFSCAGACTRSPRGAQLARLQLGRRDLVLVFCASRRPHLFLFVCAHALTPPWTPQVAH